MKVKEGEVADVTAQNLEYPDIDSCMSITCLCDGHRLVGGHAIIWPEPGQHTLDDIVHYIADNAPEHQRLYLFFVGDTGIWEQNVDLHVFQNIADQLGLGDAFTVIDIRDLPELSQRGAAYVIVSSIGVVRVCENRHGFIRGSVPGREYAFYIPPVVHAH